MNGETVKKLQYQSDNFTTWSDEDGSVAVDANTAHYQVYAGGIIYLSNFVYGNPFYDIVSLNNKYLQ